MFMEIVNRGHIVIMVMPRRATDDVARKARRPSTCPRGDYSLRTTSNNKGASLVHVRTMYIL